MRVEFLVLAAATTLTVHGELKSGPPLPHHVVMDWAQLPKGWNFGECSGVSIDKDDNVWVFNRGAHPVMQFDKSGRLLQAWTEVPVTAAHGLRVDRDGNIWTVDVAAHRGMKFTPAGRLLMMIGQVAGAAGTNETKDGFNRPTNLAFAPNGDFFVSDGYLNSRVVRYNRDGEYITHWGRKGTGDGEFDLVHDVTLDSQGRVYVADRLNQRIQIFDQNGTFLDQWFQFSRPSGIFIDKNDIIYVADSESESVSKNHDGWKRGIRIGKVSDGVVTAFIPDPVEQIKGTSAAEGVAADAAGNVYGAEVGPKRLMKYVKN